MLTHLVTLGVAFYRVHMDNTIIKCGILSRISCICQNVFCCVLYLFQLFETGHVTIMICFLYDALIHVLQILQEYLLREHLYLLIK